MNKYEEMRKRHQKRVDDFPYGFAFSKGQFRDMMKNWALKETDTDEIYYIGGGGYIRKNDLEEYTKMCEEISKEENDLIEQDKTGEGYIKDMFVYELENHEYGYTHNEDDTLNDLNLTNDQLDKNPALKHGLELAKKEILDKENIVEYDSDCE